ncbi:MAG: class I SAM-dependent methyltransferase [Candidatus Fermentibacteraceae bacterium]|nr:class I SAM-dependent methyltransferase [Candidatus Fermentibacteraceae bacterium]MBN2607760.1 class I SAM-dependent methyltransferase [Candidatus Fermentibacteraceae bacterium]
MPEEKQEWFLDRNYWRENRSLIWSKKLTESSGKAVDRVVKLLDMKEGDSVLDLACGFGRHSLEFAVRGFRVTGVDLNRELIDEAGEKARSQGLDAVFVLADMRDFAEQDSFDHIVILYNSFGYFRDPRDDMRVLRNCLTSLLPGGRLLTGVVGREVLQRSMPSRSSRYWREEGGLTVLEESTVDEDFSWIDNRWIVLEGARRRNCEYGMRIYSEEGMRDLMRRAGFDEICAYGDLSGAPYDEEAHHLLTVARKPPVPETGRK